MGEMLIDFEKKTKRTFFPPSLASMKHIAQHNTQAHQSESKLDCEKLKILLNEQIGNGIHV